jgi:hypothetical protein
MAIRAEVWRTDARKVTTGEEREATPTPRPLVHKSRFNPARERT